MTGFEEMIFDNRDVVINISVGLMGIGVCAIFPSVIQLVDNEEIAKKICKWVIGCAAPVFVLGIVGIVLAFSFRGTSPTPATSPEVAKEKPVQEREPETPIDFNSLIKLLQSEGDADRRMSRLKKNGKVIPNQISGADVKIILKCFQGDSKRLEVIKVLRNQRKLKENYTDIEESEIQGMFNRNKHLEVKKWIK